METANQPVDQWRDINSGCAGIDIKGQALLYKA